MYDSYRQRPAPYNPGHNTTGLVNSGPQCIPHYDGYVDSHTKYLASSSRPPPPPQRLYQSVPRRVHKASPPAGAPFPAYSPPGYDESRYGRYDKTDGPMVNENVTRSRPIGFEAVASLSRSQSRSRSKLPMSPEHLNSHFNPSLPPGEFYSPSGAVISSVKSYADGVVQNPPVFRPVPAPRNIPISPSAPPSVNSEVVSSKPSRTRLPTSSSSSIQSNPHSPNPLSKPHSPNDSCSHNFPRGSHRHSYGGPSPRDIGSSRGLNHSSSRVAVEKLDSSLTFVRTFGRNHSYDRIELSPRIIHMSKNAQRILVIDPQAMFVQVYGCNGQVIASFKVVGVQGGCFWTDEKLVLATHRGIRVCAAADGSLISESAIGSVANTKPFAYGFLAVQSKKLSMYAGADCALTRTIEKIRRPSKIFRRTVPFTDIKDVEVTQQQRLVILDACVIFVTDDTGRLLSKIKPQKLACGALNNPLSVCTDRFNNVIVSDTGNRRLLQFLANGSYMTTLLGWTDSSPRRDSCVTDEIVTVYGVTMSSDSLLAVVVSGGGMAEVRVYRP